MKPVLDSIDQMSDAQRQSYLSFLNGRESTVSLEILRRHTIQNFSSSGYSYEVHPLALLDLIDHMSDGQRYSYLVFLNGMESTVSFEI